MAKIVAYYVYFAGYDCVVGVWEVGEVHGMCRAGSPSGGVPIFQSVRIFCNT